MEGRPVNESSLGAGNAGGTPSPRQEKRAERSTAPDTALDTVRDRLPVLLTIRAEQDVEGEPDKVELLTEGTMELRPEGMAVTYQESPLTGMEGTTTTLEVTGPRVILRRSGTVSSQMVFEEGRQHTSLYETPYGELSVDVQTSYLRHTLTECGGQMEIRYSISVEHAATGKNHFHLRVKRKQR